MVVLPAMSVDRLLGVPLHEPSIFFARLEVPLHAVRKRRPAAVAAVMILYALM